jgi:short-subunit dehydrogenase
VKPKDLSVVLTGATGSVGAELARLLVARGARVLLVARTATALVALAHELAGEEDQRHRVDALAADVTNAAARLAIRDTAVARGANVLVNAACAEEAGPLGELNAARVDAMLQTNLVAPVQLTRILLPHLLHQREARVLSIGSALGRTGLPGASVYCASQFGLRGFSESLRRELADTNLRVQFLGRRGTWREFDDRQVEKEYRAVASGSDRPDYIAAVALRMLLAGRSEQFLGLSSSLLGHVNALVPLWLDGLLKRRRVLPRRRNAAQA